MPKIHRTDPDLIEQGALIGTAAIAKYLGVSRSTVYRMLKGGRLPCLMLGNGIWMTTKTMIDQIIMVEYDQEMKARGWGPYGELEKELERVRVSTIKRGREKVINQEKIRLEGLTEGGGV